MNSISRKRLRFDLKEAAIFGGEFPPHPFLEHHQMHAWLHGRKLKDPLSVFDGIIAGDAEKFVAEQGKSLGVIGGDPLLTPRPILP
jgi:hypothetical protein